MATKKLILTTVSFSEFELIGINTVLHEYRLAYFINKVAQLKLVRHDNLPVFNEKLKQLFDFSFYYCINDDYRLTYYLIGNEINGTRMIDQYPEANFFLLIKGKKQPILTKAILSSLRSIPNVTMVFSVVAEKIKGLDGIIQDLELHEVQIKPKTLLQKPLIDIQQSRKV